MIYTPSRAEPHMTRSAGAGQGGPTEWPRRPGRLAR